MAKKIAGTVGSVLLAMLIATGGIFASLLVIPQKIKVAPSVFDMGDENYCVLFVTSLKGSGYIKYKVNGEEKIIWDTTSGTISTHDTVHKIIVPKDELRGNTYVVGSQFVAYKLGYNAVKGRSVESEPINFRGEEKEVKKSLNYFTEEYDMLVFLGDICSDFGNKSRFTDSVLADAAFISKGEFPIVYARGNHETRGEYASQMLQYFPTSTGELYYSFDFGGLSAVVLDPGEDKEDDHKEYSGLVNFSAYREKQFSWINSLKAKDFKGRYKLVFSHDPTLTEHFGKNWAEPFAKLGFDLIVGGHHHTSSFTKDNISVFIAGGKNKNFTWAASSITLENDEIKMKTIDINGTTVLDETLRVK